MNQLETVQEQETVLDIKTILVAVDLSSHSERTVGYALSIARNFGASLKLIHVYVPPRAVEFGSEEMYRLLEEGRHDAERRLTNLTSQIRAKHPNCQSLFTNGDPAVKVARAAATMKADLVLRIQHGRLL